MSDKAKRITTVVLSGILGGGGAVAHELGASAPAWVGMALAFLGAVYGTFKVPTAEQKGGAS